MQRSSNIRKEIPPTTNLRVKGRMFKEENLVLRKIKDLGVGQKKKDNPQLGRPLLSQELKMPRGHTSSKRSKMTRCPELAMPLTSKSTIFSP